MEEQKEPSTSTSQGGGGGGGRGNGDVEEIVDDKQRRFSPAANADDEHERNNIVRSSLNEDLALSNDHVVFVSPNDA